MGLQTYRKKRKFDVTPEPRGRATRAKGNQFVIQKHAARRLHYDLRLELDGVMKSWAVTRGPSLVPGDKRLAVHVEDHPIEYNAFEGTIPQGEYGGGTVMIWDRGRWEPDGDPHRGYKKGHLIFTLEGEKLRGRWHLVRMHGRGGEKKEPWLLIKAKDDEARNPDDPDILEDKPLSVVSGRSIPEIAEGKGRKRVWHSNRSVKDNVTGGATKANASVRRASTSTTSAKTSPKTSPQSGRRPRPSAAKKKTAKKRTSKGSEKEPRPQGAPLPDFVPPSLATLRAAAPSGAGWVHEIKFDGYRIQARLDRGKVRLLTRKGLDWTSKFPNVAAAVAELPARTALIDGEVVILDAGGVSSFSGLQAALKAGERDRFLYYVFDLLHLDGRDLTGLPLIERKAELGAPRRQGATGHDQIQRRFRGIRSDDAAARLRAGARRDCLQAHGCALPHRPIGDVRQDQVLERPGIRGRRLRAVERSTAGDRCLGRGLLRSGPLHLCRPHRHRLHPDRGAGSVEAAASIGDRQAAIRSNSPRGSPTARRELG